MTKRFLAAAALTVALSVSTVLAHEHKVLGTVQTAAADHVMMTTPAGKSVTVKLAADTKVVRGKEPVKIEAVTKGTRIVVTTDSDEDPYTAKLIQVAEAPDPGAKK